jgi:hypothetical protein
MAQRNWSARDDMYCRSISAAVATGHNITIIAISIFEMFRSLKEV